VDFGFHGWPVRPEATFTARIVFAGFGITAPEFARDDFAGLNLAGKIVVVIDGAPAGMKSDARSHYGAVAMKRVEAEKRGAVGLINIISLNADAGSSAGPPALSAMKSRGAAAPPPAPSRPWSLTWSSASGTPWFPGGEVVPVARVDRSGVTKLFQGSPVSIDAIAAAARAPAGDVRGFELPSVAAVTVRTESEVVPSYNVAGLVQGTDPALRDQVIVVSAHLDHLGSQPPVKGDGIANGALDNASGVAILLEIARMLQVAPPRRPVLLVAFTGEEQGLLGADYFVRNPTVPQSSLVANINIDMPILTYEFTDVVALGAERSTIGAAVTRAAARVGVAVTPAPAALQGDFMRSDQYRFAQQGIPSVFLRTGYANGGEAASAAFLESCYHRACDDFSQPIDFVAAARFARINYEIARELADAPERPRWNAGEVFGKRIGRAAADADSARSSRN
jgi:hypothetical protein